MESEPIILLEHFSTSFMVFKELFDTGVCSDITLKVGNTEIRAHRVVLSATIPFFRLMFSNEMLESKEHEVVLNGVDAQTLELIIKFAYSGSIVITEENVDNIINEANYLQMSILVETCTTFIINRWLNVDNALKYYRIGSMLDIIRITEHCEKIIFKNFEGFLRSSDFLDLTSFEMERFLGSHDLCISSEEKVFESLMKWIYHDLKVRKKHFCSLFLKVRLPLVSPQFLIETIAKESLVVESDACRASVDEAKDYHLLPERQHLPQDYKSTPRCYVPFLALCNGVACLYNNLYACGGKNAERTILRSMECYDGKKWFKCCDMLSKRSGCGVVAVDDELYIVGGTNGTVDLRSVEIFCVRTNNHREVSPMHVERSHFGIAVLNKKIYVCGGNKNGVLLRDAEVYDIATDTWTMIRPLIHPRAGNSLTAFHGKLYSIGPFDELKLSNFVEIFDPPTGKWSALKTLPQLRA